MSKDKKAQKISLIGKNVILRGEVEPTSIILKESENRRRIKELKVFLIGDEVTKVAVGDEVRVDSAFMLVASQSKQINPFYYNGSDYKEENEFYILASEDDIIGKF